MTPPSVRGCVSKTVTDWALGGGDELPPRVMAKQVAPIAVSADEGWSTDRTWAQWQWSGRVDLIPEIIDRASGWYRDSPPPNH